MKRFAPHKRKKIYLCLRDKLRQFKNLFHTTPSFELHFVERPDIVFKVEGNFGDRERKIILSGIERIYSEYLNPDSCIFVGQDELNKWRGSDEMWWKVQLQQNEN